MTLHNQHHVTGRKRLLQLVLVAMVCGLFSLTARAGHTPKTPPLPTRFIYHYSHGEWVRVPFPRSHRSSRNGVPSFIKGGRAPLQDMFAGRARGAQPDFRR